MLTIRKQREYEGFGKIGMFPLARLILLMGCGRVLAFIASFFCVCVLSRSVFSSPFNRLHPPHFALLKSTTGL